MGLTELAGLDGDRLGSLSASRRLGGDRLGSLYSNRLGRAGLGSIPVRAPTCAGVLFEPPAQCIPPESRLADLLT